MDKELEESIKYLKLIRKNHDLEKKGYVYTEEAIETVLNYIENSIPKEVIEKYLKEEQEHFEIYKKESKTNENLKMGMWKHLGAKNMCERILGIGINIVTLDELSEGK